MTSPPITAPGMLPIPPEHGGHEGLEPGQEPHQRVDLRVRRARPAPPPAAASALPSAKVKVMIRSVGIPIRLAASRLNETARIARPIRVR